MTSPAHRATPSPIPAARDGSDDIWLHRVLHVGMIWLVVGMAIMPAGVSYNPGRLYQYLLGLTLYLPALALLLMRPRAWLSLWRQSAMPWVVLLLAWGSVSLLWSNARHPLNELARNLSIMLFLFGWLRAMATSEGRIRRLLVGCGFAFALVSVVAMLWYRGHPPLDRRMLGFGVMANPNLAAAAMAVALLWLGTWPEPDLKRRVAQWMAMCVLALFVLLTNTRSAWAALFAALLVLVLCRQGRHRWWQAGVLLLLGVVGTIAGMPELTARGWSLRPRILTDSWELFARQPWLGLGQGASFHIEAGNEVLVHTHNMFSQLAVELGLPGLLLWSGIWLALGLRGWRHRYQPLGRLILATWVFAMIMVQFDLPHLLDSPRPDWLITWLPLALGFSLATNTAGASVKLE